MTRIFGNDAVAGAALMVLAGASFAVVNVAVQAAMMLRGAPPGAVVFWQYAIAFALCLPFLDLRRAWSAPQKGWHVLRVVFAAVGVQFWVYGLAFVPIWQAIALILLSPFFVTLGAGLFLGERVTVARGIAVVTGIIGGCIVLAPWSDAFSRAALFPVMAAVFWAASSLVTKRLAVRQDAGILTIWLLALLVPVNFALAWGGGFAVPGWGFVVVAGAATALAQGALAQAYRRADAAYLQPFDHLKLPMNVAAGFAAFGFAPEGWIWGGVVLIAAAGMALMWVEARGGAVAAAPRMR